MKTTMRRILPSIIIPAFAFTIFLTCYGAPVRPEGIRKGDYSYVKRYLEWCIRKEMSRKGIQGLSIAIVDDQSVVMAEGFGWAVKSKKVPATKETLYQIGSVSKVFTALAAMRLVEENRLDIEKPVSHYIKGFTYKKRFNAPEPTVRHLMYHHAGLPSDNFSIFFTKRESVPFTKMAESLVDEYAAYPPDHVFSYCNLCVTLEGHIVQNAAGEDFVAYTDRALFKPMGMDHTSFSNEPRDPALMSKGYLKGKETDHYIVNPMPAGSIISSVVDLAEFMKTLFAGGRHGGAVIAGDDTIARMYRPQNSGVPLDLDMRFGLGWWLSGLDVLGGARLDYKGVVAWHGGSTVLFNSVLAVLPELKLGVVVLTNTSTAQGAAATIAVEALNRAVGAKTGIAAQRAETEKPRSLTMDPEELGAYEGLYATEYAGAMKITTSGRRGTVKVAGFPLKMNFMEGKKFSLSFLGYTPSMLKDRYFSIEEVAGKTVMVGHIYGKRYLVGARVDPVPVPGAWLRRVGSYVPAAPGDAVKLYEDMEIRFHDGFLFVYFRIRGVPRKVPYLILLPVSDSEAITAGLGRNMGQTVRALSRKGRESILFSGAVFRKSD